MKADKPGNRIDALLHLPGIKVKGLDMTIYFENESEIDFSPEFDPEDLCEEILDAFLDYVQCPFETEVSLLLVSKEKIQEINKETRNIDNATDVLSFPMNHYPIAEDFSHLENCPDAFHPETGELLLGDIVISVEHIKKQAEDYGHSRKREFAFLLVHSLLHLIGYDHMEDGERIIMEKKQKDFLSSIGIER